MIIFIQRFFTMGRLDNEIHRRKRLVHEQTSQFYK